MSSLSNTVARFASTLDYSGVPSKVVQHTRLMLADTVAVALAASGEEVVQALRRFASQDRGTCAVWDTPQLTTARNAALVNGSLAHALDFDDNNMSMIGHSSAPVVPAVLALADEESVTLADVIVAYIVGVQVESVLGIHAGLEHNARGWHTTSTLGTFGASAACCRLLRLDAAQTQHALGLAASMASGLRQNFPSMTKALHAGIAAENGVRAARLAQAGVRSAPDAIEGDEGFFKLYAGQSPAASNKDDIGGFEILESFPKVYPTCSMVHQALDVLLAAMKSGEVRAQEVTKLECEASYHALNIMRYPDPQDTPQARFSMQYCLAVALLAGKVPNEWFHGSRVRDPRIREAMGKIEVRLAPEQATKELFEKLYLEGRAVTRVTVTHADGSKFRGEASLQKGHPGNPLDVQGFREKFMTCVAPSRGVASAADLWSVLVQGDVHSRFRPAAHLATLG